AETCDGSSTACPTDVFKASGTFVQVRVVLEREFPRAVVLLGTLREELTRKVGRPLNNGRLLRLQALVHTHPPWLREQLLARATIYDDPAATRARRFVEEMTAALRPLV